MRNQIHFPKAISGNRLKIALASLGIFIVIIAGLYYYMSFKKSHIPQNIEGTWICQQYIDSVANRKSISQVTSAPMFVQMAFKKSWIDSVVCTGYTSTYTLQLKKHSKEKYILARFSDTLGTIHLTHDFVFNEHWNNADWNYIKVDTTFKRSDKGNLFRQRLNHALISGKYAPLLGKGMLSEVTFSDSGTIAGIRGINSYKLCFSPDGYYSTKPKDAIFIGNTSNAYKYAFDIVGDTLNIYTVVATDSSAQFKPYWRLLRLAK